MSALKANWGAVLVRENRAKLKREIETSKEREKLTKDELALARDTCKVLLRGCSPKALDERCRHVAERCAATLTRLRRRLRDESAQREGARTTLRATRSPGQKRQAEKRRESDYSATHEIPVELHGLWRREKHRFPYSLQSDERAIRFMEWTQLHAGDVKEYLERHWDRVERDIIAEAEERDRMEQAAHDEVPF